MPLIIIEAWEGRTVEQKRGLVRDITAAVCKNFAVGPEAVDILIHEGKKENSADNAKLSSDSYLSFSSLGVCFSTVIINAFLPPECEKCFFFEHEDSLIIINRRYLTS